MKYIAKLTFIVAAISLSAFATETENVRLRIIKAPGAVNVDADSSDWDFSGSIFCCPDIEKFRTSYAVWISAMYDKDNLYFFFRWLDATPMNNPGLAGSDYPWQGDCMQVRLATSPQSKTAFNGLRHNTDVSKLPMKFAHFEFWRDRNATAAASATLAFAAQPKGEDVMSKGVKEHFRGVCPRREADEEGGADRGGEDIRKSRVRDCYGVCAGRRVSVAACRRAGGGRAWLRNARLAAREGSGRGGVKGGMEMTANKIAGSVGPVPAMPYAGGSRAAAVGQGSV